MVVAPEGVVYGVGCEVDFARLGDGAKPNINSVKNVLVSPKRENRKHIPGAEAQNRRAV